MFVASVLQVVTIMLLENSKSTSSRSLQDNLDIPGIHSCIMQFYED